MKTNELTGAALDWAVAQCEGRDKTYLDHFASHWHLNKSLRYSANWAQGGPIIERERIAVWFSKGDWKSQMRDTSAKVHGHAPLIAAMRCYVASRLGDEVKIPKELAP